MLRLVLRVAEERINKANDILKNISLGSCGAGVVVDEISVRVVVVVCGGYGSPSQRLSRGIESTWAFPIRGLFACFSFYHPSEHRDERRGIMSCIK